MMKSANKNYYCTELINIFNSETLKDSSDDRQSIKMLCKLISKKCNEYLFEDGISTDIAVNMIKTTVCIIDLRNKKRTPTSDVIDFGISLIFTCSSFLLMKKPNWNLDLILKLSLDLCGFEIEQTFNCSIKDWNKILMLMVDKRFNISIENRYCMITAIEKLSLWLTEDKQLYKLIQFIIIQNSIFHLDLCKLKYNLGYMKSLCNILDCLEEGWFEIIQSEIPFKNGETGNEDRVLPKSIANLFNKVNVQQIENWVYNLLEFIYQYLMKFKVHAFHNINKDWLGSFDYILNLLKTCLSKNFYLWDRPSFSAILSIHLLRIIQCIISFCRLHNLSNVIPSRGGDLCQIIKKFFTEQRTNRSDFLKFILTNCKEDYKIILEKAESFNLDLGLRASDLV